MTHTLDMPVSGVRELVFMRQFGLCARCGGPMSFADFEAHHRRRRNVLGWCPCNIVALHPRCHTQGELAVHDNVEQSRTMGLIVPTFGPEPYDVPLWVHSETPHGVSGAVHVLLSCDGLVTRLGGPVYVDAEQTAHAVRLSDHPGRTVCGFPPRKRDGSRWLGSDPPGRLLHGVVDCRFCLEEASRP